MNSDQIKESVKELVSNFEVEENTEQTHELLRAKISDHLDVVVESGELGGYIVKVEGTHSTLTATVGYYDKELEQFHNQEIDLNF